MEGIDRNKSEESNSIDCLIETTFYICIKILQNNKFVIMFSIGFRRCVTCTFQSQMTFDRMRGINHFFYIVQY